MEVTTDGVTSFPDYRGIEVAPEDGYVGLSVKKGKAVLSSSGSNQWCKLMDLDNGRPQNFELHLEEDINGRRSSQRYWLTNGPYGQALSITRLPSALFNDGNVREVAVNTTTPPGGANSVTEVWIRVAPIAVAGVVHFWFINSLGGVIEHPTPTPDTPSFTAASVREELESRYEAMVLPGILARKGLVSGAQGLMGGAVRARLWIKGHQPEGGDTGRMALFETAAGASILDIQDDGIRIGVGADVDGAYYVHGTQVVGDRQAHPGDATGGANTSIPNDSPENAHESRLYSGSDGVNLADVKEDLNLAGQKLNAHARKLNAQADAYNYLANKYNDLASRFNTLLDKLQAHGLIG
jgi:hypothetical protein